MQIRKINGVGMVFMTAKCFPVISPTPSIRCQVFPDFNENVYECLIRLYLRLCETESCTRISVIAFTFLCGSSSD